MDDYLPAHTRACKNSTIAPGVSCSAAKVKRTVGPLGMQEEAFIGWTRQARPEGTGFHYPSRGPVSVRESPARAHRRAGAVPVGSPEPRGGRARYGDHAGPEDP